MRPRGFAITILLLATCCLPGNACGDATSYRTGVLDPRVRQIPAEIQQGVFRDPAEYLKPLAEFLIAGARDDYHKVKLLHDWIADNIEYDVESYFGGEQAGSTGDNTLLRQRAVCQGYGNLMQQACEAVGIPCRTIAGYGRGYGFSQGQEIADGQENHVWNSVHVDGAWRLVDVTWDAGHVQGREYLKDYSTTYLFMPPEQFVYTHLPTEARWQLLSKPLTSERFQNLPYLRGVFFDHGLRLGTSLSRVTSVGSTVKIKVYHETPVEMMSKLLSGDGQEWKSRTLEQADDGLQSILVAFPAAGRHKVKLYCRQRGDAKLMDMIGELDFEASAGTPKTFPKTYAHFGRLQGRLDSPLFVPLPTETDVRFQIRLRGARDVRLAIGDQQPWLRFKRATSEQDVYELEAKLPVGARVRLNAKLSPQDESYGTLIDFTSP